MPGADKGMFSIDGDSISTDRNTPNNDRDISSTDSDTPNTDRDVFSTGGGALSTGRSTTGVESLTNCAIFEDFRSLGRFLGEMIVRVNHF